MPWRNVTNMANVASSSRYTIDTVTAGTSGLSPSRTDTRPFRAKTNVARKVPSVRWVSRDRTNTRTMRGEYCPPASWIATSVVANTTPRKVSIAVATVAESAAAASALTLNNHDGVSRSSTARSMATVSLGQHERTGDEQAGYEPHRGRDALVEVQSPKRLVDRPSRPNVSFGRMPETLCVTDAASVRANLLLGRGQDPPTSS